MTGDDTKIRGDDRRTTGDDANWRNPLEVDRLCELPLVQRGSAIRKALAQIGEKRRHGALDFLEIHARHARPLLHERTPNRGTGKCEKKADGLLLALVPRTPV